MDKPIEPFTDQELVAVLKRYTPGSLMSSEMTEALVGTVRRMLGDSVEQPTTGQSASDEQRWIARVKSVEWRADIAALALAGDIRGLEALLERRPGAAPPGDPELQRELAKLYGCDPSFGTSPDEALAARHALPKLIAKVRELQAKLDGSASVEAFNAIATLLGCPAWDYPGQLVRDVQALKERAETAEALVLLRDVDVGTQKLRAEKAEAELEHADKRLRFETTKDDRERRQLGRELFGDEHA